jgi:phage baseplate assembly protein W
MSIKIGNIPALDFQESTGIGLALPFLASPTSGSDSLFKVNYTTAEQIKYNLINYFLHMKGERIFNPNFGSVINNFVFEQIDDFNISTLKGQIQEEVSLIFPQIKVTSINVIPDTEYHTVTIQIFYSVFNSLNEFVEFNIIV